MNSECGANVNEIPTEMEFLEESVAELEIKVKELWTTFARVIGPAPEKENSPQDKEGIVCSMASEIRELRLRTTNAIMSIDRLQNSSKL